jgi:RNA recognition motif-containing protein
MFRNGSHLLLDSPNDDENIKGDPYKTIFVGRLNWNTTEAALERFFSNYGPISNIRLVRDVGIIVVAASLTKTFQK